MWRTRPPAALAAALAAAVPGCGGGGRADRPDVPAQIRRDLAGQLGVAVERVTCPDGPYPRVCAAELAGASLPIVVVEDGAGGLAWRLDGLVIAAAALEARVEDELDGLGVAGKADCGPRARRVEVGEQLRCALDVPGGPGVALVTILDEEPAIAIELALDPAAAAARTAERDEAALDRVLATFDPGEAPADEEPEPPPAAAEGAGAAVAAGSAP